jgi:SAM-dependent methyltransferase
MEMIKKYLKQRALKVYIEAEKLDNLSIKKIIEKYVSGKNITDLKLLDTSCWDYKNASDYIPDHIQKYGTDLVLAPSVPSEVDFHIWNPNIERAPFIDDYFDIITSNMVWEHLSDVDNYIDELYRILKPGGLLIIATNNLGNWPNIFCLIVGWMPFDMQNFSKKRASFGNPLGLHTEESIHPAMTHKSIYAPRAVKEVAEFVGFNHIETDYIGYFPYNFLSKIDKRHSLFFVMSLIK